MTIKLKLDITDPEYECADKIKQIFMKDESLKNNSSNEIFIIPSVQCYGQQPQDIDVVVFGFLKDYRTMVDCSIHNETDVIEKREVKINNFCCVIEVKKHDAERIEINGTKIYVTTQGEKKEVTAQNIGQKHSLRKFLIKQIKSAPWISNAIFFPSASKEDFEETLPKMNLLFKTFNVSDFFEILLSQRHPIRYSGDLMYSAGLDRVQFKKCCTMLTKKLSATRLDRKRVEDICREIVKEQRYGDKLGAQLLIFRGGGGTGKTYRLLNLAHKLYDKNLARVLVLTYNHALIADIQRLFAIMKIRDGIDESIQIRTLHSFWFSFFHKIGIRTKDDMNCENNYKISKEMIYEARQVIKANPRKLTEISIEFPNLLCWDYVMIDEAQDWPINERNLLYSLFSPEKIVVADGRDQLIRTGIACNWADSSLVKDKQVVPLTKSMRQKPNIVRFLKEISKKLDIQNVNIEEEDTLHGGKVILLFGDYDKQFHERLIKSNTDSKNENVDMLFCMPPSLMSGESNTSILSDKLKSWGFSVWDGVNDETRKSFPTDVNQIRIVKYDSCRGLEGWITVNFEFDRFYEYKLESFKEEKGQIQLKSIEERTKDFASNWLLIPLTRSMDTLVLQIKDSNSYIGKILMNIAKENPEYIETIFR